MSLLSPAAVSHYLTSTLYNTVKWITVGVLQVLKKKWTEPWHCHRMYCTGDMGSYQSKEGTVEDTVVSHSAEWTCKSFSFIKKSTAYGRH